MILAVVLYDCRCCINTAVKAGLCISLVSYIIGAIYRTSNRGSHWRTERLWTCKHNLPFFPSPPLYRSWSRRRLLDFYWETSIIISRSNLCEAVDRQFYYVCNLATGRIVIFMVQMQLIGEPELGSWLDFGRAVGKNERASRAPHSTCWVFKINIGYISVTLCPGFSLSCRHCEKLQVIGIESHPTEDVALGFGYLLNI